MSWSFSGETEYTNDEFNDIYDIEVSVNEDAEGVKEAQEKQVRWAKETLVDALDCGVVGRNRISFTVHGHANPHHKPRSGFVNDFVTIMIKQHEEV